MSKKIIDSYLYIELADDIANGVMEELFCHLLPNLDEEAWDPEGAHRECAETEDAIRMIARGELECYFQISDAEPLVSDDEHAGVELTQEEVDTLLTDKTGGMYNV